jgi:hypothetical protein
MGKLLERVTFNILKSHLGITRWTDASLTTAAALKKFRFPSIYASNPMQPLGFIINKINLLSFKGHEMIFPNFQNSPLIKKMKKSASPV